MSYHQALLALHILAIAFSLGIGFTNLINMRVSKGQTGDVAKGLGLHRMAVRPYGDIFVGLFLVTGILLVVNMGGTAGLNSWFHVKMAAVVILVLCYIGIRYTVSQMMKSGNMALMARVKTFAHIAITASVVAVICAVLTFAA